MEHTFTKLGLSSDIVQAIDELGFETPTPIQEQAIPLLLTEDRDLVGLAQTGTGKTAAFGLPILQHIDLSQRQVQTLILAPTRELALQIEKDLRAFAKYRKGVSIVPVYGGANIRTQIMDIKKGAHIVVGTPGRVCDLIRRRSLKLDQVRWFVLDEADEMLKMGFQDEMDQVREALPEEKQTLLFSATMLESIVSTYLQDPIEIRVARKNIGASTVSHIYHMVHASDKYEALKRICDMNPSIYGIVFCRTRRDTKSIAEKLMHDGYNADALHGDLSQEQREYVMNRFRAKHIQILVATDVAARGLDVDNLTHVIHYALPDDPDTFIHRSGRTGRAGKEGTSVAIIHMREQRKIRELQKMVGKEIERKHVPTGEDICQVQLMGLIESLRNTEVDHDSIRPYLEVINETLEDLSRDDIIKRVISVEFNRFLSYYQGKKDLDIPVRGERSQGGRDGGRRDRRDRRDRGDRRGGNRSREWGDRGDRRGDSNYYGGDSTRGNRPRFRGQLDGQERAPRKQRGDSGRDLIPITLNVGKKDRAHPRDIINYINGNTRNRKIDIGHIEIQNFETTVEIEREYVDLVIESSQGRPLYDKMVRFSRKKGNKKGSK